jgi:hypothetical protein
MLIVCTTVDVAAQVLVILLDAQLWPRTDYKIHPVISPTPPVTFTLLRAVSPTLLSQIRALPDIKMLE